MAKTIAAYGGGFKPPTAGHFEVVKTALEQNPEIDEFIIYVGGGERDGITQAEAILIWEIYQTYLPMKVKIEPSKAPIGDIVRLGKNNLQDTVYFVIGGREGREDDMKDIESRTKGIEDKYPNMKIKIIQTPDTGMSGTNARQAAKVSYEDFIKYLPTELTDEEKEEVYNIVKPAVKESLNENASYSSDIDYKEHIKELTKYMIEDGWNILPLPKVVFKHGDSENARDFFGKTAYYDPNTQTIVLYTEGRHPKDIVRSFSHEMVHHEQNLDGRLGDIQTTNTQEDDYLNDIEAEANLNGTMTFRNWTDSLQENQSTKATKVFVMKSPFTPKGWDFDHIGFVLDNGMLKDMSGHRYDKNQPMPPMTYKYEDTEELFQMPKDKNEAIKKGLYKEKSLPKPIEIPSNVACDIKDPNKKAINCGSFVKIVLSNSGIETTKSNKPGDIFKAIPTNTLAESGQKIAKKNMDDYKKSNNPSDKVSDPFGLSQYARELAQDLEEEILPQEKFAQETNQDYIKKALAIFPQKEKYNLEDYTVKVLPLDKIKPTQFGEDYINASSEYEAEQYKEYIKGEISAQDLRKEDFYPIVVDRDTMEILDGNHRHAVHTMLGIPKIKAILVSKKLNEAKPYKHKHGFDDKLGKDPFGLNAYARELVNETFKKSVTIDMGPILKALKFKMPTGQETDENVIAVIDAAPQGTVPHPVFLDFYAKFDKYFGEENDSRMLDNFGLEYLLSKVLNLSNEDIQIVINHYNTTDQDSVEWFEQHDNELEKKEEWNVDGFDPTQDNLATVNQYLSKNKKLHESDPKKGTGKKPKGSDRRLYTDEDPKDTVGIKFRTKEDIVDTLNKKSFKAKSHARQSQIINLIHQRVRAAYQNAKDAETKARLKRGLDYIESRKEASKEKTKRLRKENLSENQNPQEKLEYYKNYYINLSPSIFDITTKNDNIVISGIDKNYPQNFNVENVRQVPINENVPSAKDDGKATPYGSGYEKVKEEMFQSSKIENQLKQKYSEVLEKLFLFEKGNYIELNLIKIKPEYKGQGWATKILDDLSEYAQENNKILTLTPSDTFGASKSRLEKFYKRFGFVPNKGKNKDFTTKDIMIRPLSEDTSELFTIYLDLDGVIADFDKRFKELAGMGPQEYEDSFGTEKFWDFIDNKHGVKFWTGIKWMPEGQKLYNFIKQFDHKLLSAPSRNDASKIGKKIWAKKNTPGTQLILAAAVNKQNYADKSNILIDDREKNIQQWKDAGGIGILFKSTDQVIDELKKIMNL